MTRDLRIDAAQGIVIVGWKSGEDGLLLRVRGQNEEVRLVCVCGRRHWLVREPSSDGVVSLSVTCHGCGTRGTFRMEGVRLPAP
jgi:hypothetical protein